jgi:hypothetical protein
MPNFWEQFSNSEMQRVYAGATFEDKTNIIKELSRRAHDPTYQTYLQTILEINDTKNT